VTSAWLHSLLLALLGSFVVSGCSLWCQSLFEDFQMVWLQVFGISFGGGFSHARVQAIQGCSWFFFPWQLVLVIIFMVKVLGQMIFFMFFLP
jgi:hypothetical protein